MREPDVGLSNERTALAWQRTALSLLAGVAVVARLTFDDVGLLLLLPLGVAGLLALWVFAESRFRYRRPAAGVRRGGRAPFALAVATVLIAAVELIAIAAS
ncbi:DUF202 domain-containing protein [Nocardioides sp. GXZ039]|uniref:DUF202 domain-containing protein n=1 Tax=Nocardioides sp. GXZ039 TaxID=3136018 RepID=UPI0030F45F19